MSGTLHWCSDFFLKVQREVPALTTILVLGLLWAWLLFFSLKGKDSSNISSPSFSIKILAQDSPP